jgi:hypothetical protein
MKLTKHADKRKQQRGFSDTAINIIMRHGRMSKVRGDAYKLFFGKKESHTLISELKQMIKLVDRARDGVLIISGETVITVYKSKAAN